MPTTAASRFVTPARRLARRAALVVTALLLASPLAARAQTPSALAEWQFSAGEVLAKRYATNGTLPEWRRVVSVGAQTTPEYEGASDSRLLPSAVVEARWRDLAFASTVEGLGVNLLRGRDYRAGVALATDLGRDETDNPGLEGFGDIDPAPTIKLFGEIAPLPNLPLVVRAAMTKFTSGGSGLNGDLSVYMPVVGTEKLIVFVGPTLSWADQDSMQRSFGVNTEQSLQTGLPRSDLGGGLRAAHFGANGTYFVRPTYFVNVSAGYQRLLNAAKESVISEEDEQYTVSVLVGKAW